MDAIDRSAPDPRAARFRSPEPDHLPGFPRCHRSPNDPLLGPARFVKRPPQPAVHDVAIEDRITGAVDWVRLTSAALAEAERAERKGRPLMVPADGTSIKSPALRLLVGQAKKEMGVLRARGRLRQAMGAAGQPPSKESL